MTTYVIRRLLYGLLIVLLVSMIVFSLIRTMPGDPIQTLISQAEITAAMAGGVTGDITDYYEQLRRDLWLDRPIPIQYARWLGRMVQGDFGRSIIRNYNIRSELGSRIVVTLFLGFMSFIISNILGIALGIISAVRRGKIIDSVVTVIANVGMTVPSFLVAILLIYVFGYLMELVPIFGYQLPWIGDTAHSIRQSILPISVMALGPLSSTARQTRSSVLEVLNQDHVRTAWAKGMREKAVIIRHVLKNAMMPIVTLQGTMLRLIFGGSAIVESIFVIPGMGQMMVTAMLSNDYPVIQACTLVLTVVVVLSNLLVDLLYGWVDPRIQLT